MEERSRRPGAGAPDFAFVDVARPVPDPLRAAAFHGFLVLALTSVHHAYGAWLYATPWRHHAVVLAAATAVAMILALVLRRHAPSGGLRRVGGWVLAVVVLVVPIGLIGGFEGAYNHLLKDLLHLVGAEGTSAVLFPPPRYEPPNDLAFEATGLLQILPAAAALRHLGRWAKEQRRVGRAAPSEPASTPSGTPASPRS